MRIHTPTGCSRRSFLSLGAAAAGALALGCSDQPRSLSGPLLDQDRERALPADPTRSGLDHVIVVMMENRSFDHFLGWLPEADGRQAGLAYTDRTGVRRFTHPLAPDFQGCGFADPDHSFAGGRIELNGGACDGWLRAGQNDLYSIGYYRRQDLPFLGSAAPLWTSFDRYFCGILGPTFPNRFYQHSAQTDRLSNTLVLATMPTIWDRLAAQGLAGRYYFSDLPFIALWGSQYQSITAPIASFFADCAAGTLPELAFVDPPFAGEGQGTSGDDHPQGDIRAGEDFLNRIYEAVTRSPGWARTALVITFDEWGGFFDHVPPPAGPIPDLDLAAGNTDGLRGFRIPVVLISPFAARRRVSHTVYDHTSILKLVEWRWGLDPLTVRDAAANNLAMELDFGDPHLAAPAFSVPAFTPAPCPSPVAGGASSAAGLATAAQVRPWAGLRELARRSGWDV